MRQRLLYRAHICLQGLHVRGQLSQIPGDYLELSVPSCSGPDEPRSDHQEGQRWRELVELLEKTHSDMLPRSTSRRRPLPARTSGAGRVYCRRTGSPCDRRPSRIGVPNGIRTRVSALKGLNPRPLDDGDAETCGPRSRRQEPTEHFSIRHSAARAKVRSLQREVSPRGEPSARTARLRRPPGPPRPRSPRAQGPRSGRLAAVATPPRRPGSTSGVGLDPRLTATFRMLAQRGRPAVSLRMVGTPPPPSSDPRLLTASC